MNVTAQIPSGNARILETRRVGDTVDIDFMPSPAGGPEAMWFYFRVEPQPQPPPRTIRCRLLLPDNLLGGGSYETGFLPVYKTENQDWTRVPYIDPKHREDGRPVCEWVIPGNEGTAEVALCYPYSTAELDQLTKDTSLNRDVIGLSDHERLLLRLGNGPGETDSKRPGIYCTARHHAGETPGSWMLDGFLREIAVAGKRAPLVWTVPFVDVDGVADGSYGKDRFPWDYNRAYGSHRYPKALWKELGKEAMRYEVKCIQNDMLHWQTRCRPMLALDFHAPTIGEAKGIYGFVRDVDSQGQADADHRPWTDAFDRALGDQFADPQFVHSGRYLSRWNTARAADFANEALNIPHITFETPYAHAGDHTFTRETYGEAGARIANAVLAHLRNGQP